MDTSDGVAADIKPNEEETSVKKEEEEALKAELSEEESYESWSERLTRKRRSSEAHAVKISGEVRPKRECEVQPKNGNEVKIELKMEETKIELAEDAVVVDDDDSQESGFEGFSQSSSSSGAIGDSSRSTEDNAEDKAMDVSLEKPNLLVTDLLSTDMECELTEDPSVSCAPAEEKLSAATDATKQSVSSPHHKTETVDSVMESPVDAAKTEPVDAAMTEPDDPEMKSPVDAAMTEPDDPAMKSPVDAAVKNPVDAVMKSPVDDESLDSAMEMAPKESVDNSMKSPVEEIVDNVLESTHEEESTEGNEEMKPMEQQSRENTSCTNDTSGLSEEWLAGGGGPRTPEGPAPSSPKGCPRTPADTPPSSPPMSPVSKPPSPLPSILKERPSVTTLGMRPITTLAASPANSPSSPVTADHCSPAPELEGASSSSLASPKLPLTTLGSLDEDLPLTKRPTQLAVSSEAAKSPLNEPVLPQPARAPVKRKLSILEYRQRRSVNSESDYPTSHYSASQGPDESKSVYSTMSFLGKHCLEALSPSSPRSPSSPALPPHSTPPPLQSRKPTPSDEEDSSSDEDGNYDYSNLSPSGSPPSPPSPGTPPPPPPPEEEDTPPPPPPPPPPPLENDGLLYVGSLDDRLAKEFGVRVADHLDSIPPRL